MEIVFMELFITARGCTLSFLLNLMVWKSPPWILSMPRIPISWAMWQLILESPTTPLLMDVKLGVSEKGLCRFNHSRIFLQSCFVISMHWCSNLVDSLQKEHQRIFLLHRKHVGSAVIPIIYLDSILSLIPRPWFRSPIGFMFFMSDCSIAMSLHMPHHNLSVRGIVKFSSVVNFLYSFAVIIFFKLWISCKYKCQHLPNEKCTLLWKYREYIFLDL